MLTYEGAAKYLEAHSFDHRPSKLDGHIQGRMGVVYPDRTSAWIWEDIPLTFEAIRRWLGY